MLIISWNVAGLSTTLQRIHGDYQSHSASDRIDPNNKKEKLPQNHAFSYFLSRHGSPDILCIQEHKISRSQLSSRSEKLGASTLEGYESFWSCCTDPNQKGFHGVVTYAKVGTVIAANVACLGSPDLDAQGRVCMTDHGNFVVFNVYAPSDGAMPLSYKMRFLNALRRAMRYQKKEKGKKVILVGDLNIVARREDIYWEYRSLNIDNILGELQESYGEIEGIVDQQNKPSQNDLIFTDDEAKDKTVYPDKIIMNGIPKWKRDLATHWTNISSVLRTMEAVPVTTTNTTTGATFEKYRIRVKIDEKFKVFIGDAESTKEDALGNFYFPKCTYFDHDLQEESVSRDENMVSIGILRELMLKIAKVEWDITTLRSISNDVMHRNSSPPARWLNGILDDDDMVDAFRLSYPNAQARFTCWNQRTNKRFENKGCRIDYTLLDKSFLSYIDTGPTKRLRCCKYPLVKFDDEEASLHAATASGSFLGASYDGGGIAVASQDALDTQFGYPHTGIIYTPPSYSDHVAVSLLLKNDFCKEHMSSKLVLDENDVSTKKAQPHKAQKCISSFFGNRNGNRESSVKRKSHTVKDSQRITKKQNVIKKEGKNSILHHFSFK